MWDGDGGLLPAERPMGQQHLPSLERAQLEPSEFLLAAVFESLGHENEEDLRSRMHMPLKQKDRLGSPENPRTLA
jgi:hypothetical protein